ncbi:DUF1127 domain-containing protein [Taklimakanibacter deserti]|uniref:DUF1127 domain-containing protein n=1 Tax=Taklimakanibacter deserti TaxID=2267839 RepID=UPI000E653DB1
MLVHSQGGELKSRRRWFGFLTLLQRWRNFVETRRAVRRLSAADNYMLKDIGISRGDVERLVRHGRPPEFKRSTRE